MVEATEAMGGDLVAGEAQALWFGAEIDSRRIEGGELFFALAGERTDGHHFVGHAFARGASAVVVRETVEAAEGRSVIRVPDTFAALHALTRHVRKRLPERLVAITGSTGKTTTKELLASMLSRRYRVAKSPGNFNNLYGFPVALLSIPEETEWMVAEMGMSTPGELSRLSRLGRPDVALFTNVRAAHLEYFSSIREIAEAKAELLEGLATGGVVVANADDPEIQRVVERHRGTIVRFGLEGPAEHRAEKLQATPSGGTRFVWHYEGEPLDVHLPLLGAHNVSNFLAAAACAATLGVAREDIRNAAAGALPMPGRGQVFRLRGATVVDDSYNSNPAALTAALESARALPGERHWAVLGDMLELGGASAEFHRQAGREAATMGFSPIIAVGKAARELVSSARAEGAEVTWCADGETAAEQADERLTAGDVLLVKGSRGVGLEVVVRRLSTQEAGD